MIELLDQVSVAGGSQNEDRLGSADFGSARAAWVLDGATGVGEREHVPPALNPAGTDAAWLAATASDILASRNPGRMDAVRYLGSVIGDLREAYGLAVPDFADLPTWSMPSATLMWLRTGPGALEFAWIGDSTAVVVQGGMIRRVGLGEAGSWETHLSAADRAKLAGQSSDKQRVKAMIDELRGKRSRLNQNDGYWMFGIEPSAAAGIALETVALRGEALVLLATDGLMRLVDGFGLYDAAGLVQAAEKRGLAALVAELRHAEHADVAGERAPRVKMHDDASALLLRVSV